MCECLVCLCVRVKKGACESEKERGDMHTETPRGTDRETQPDIKWFIPHGVYLSLQYLYGYFLQLP